MSIIYCLGVKMEEPVSTDILPTTAPAPETIMVETANVSHMFNLFLDLNVKKPFF